MAFYTTAITISMMLCFTLAVYDDTISNSVSNNDLGSHRVIYREEWGGKPPQYVTPLTPPVDYVIISHSAGRFLTTTSNCSRAIRDIQTLHMSHTDSQDIGYNFLICGDGNIYVGRDWYARNMHMDNSIGICFIGNYMYDYLTESMVEAAQLLLELGLEKRILSEDYNLVGHNQTYSTLSPGENVYKVIKTWPHFYPEQINHLKL